MKSIGPLLFTALVVLAFLAAPAHSYTLLGVQVNATFNPDGSAHVTERYSILLDNDTETETFENYRVFGQNTIIEWRQFLSGLNYHISGPSTPLNTKISASRLLEIGSRSALIQLDYDLDSNITTPQQVKSRLVDYTFNPSYLSFGTTSAGEDVLPAGTTLIFNAPAGASLDLQGIYPTPATVAGGSVTWVGPITSKWRFDYTVEESLSDEVRNYFNGLYDYSLTLLPWLLPAGLLILVGVFVYNKFGQGPGPAKKH